jgi:integrase
MPGSSSSLVPVEPDDGPAARGITDPMGDLPRPVYPERDLYVPIKGRRFAHHWVMPDLVDPQLDELIIRIGWSVSDATRRDYRPYLLNSWEVARRHGRSPFSLEHHRDYLWALAYPRIVYLRGLEQGEKPRRRGLEPGLGINSLSVALAALAALCSAAGHPTPREQPGWRSWWKGVLRRLARPVDRKAPILRDDLVRAVALTRKVTPPLRGLRDRALLLLGWSCCLRRSELVAIDVSHLQEHPDGWGLFLPRSKTDQGRVGRTIPIYPAKDPDFDPLLAVQDWLKAAGITAGPVFRGINRLGQVLADPINGETVRLILRQYAVRPNVSGHSLRIGYVSQAGNDGKDNFSIRIVSRHNSDAMVNLYRRVTDARRQGPGSLL